MQVFRRVHRKYIAKANEAMKENEELSGTIEAAISRGPFSYPKS
jgi:hypothetical protein